MLTNALANDNFNAEVKMFTICAIGDLILVMEDKFKPYFKDTMEMLIKAGQMSVQLSPDISQQDLKTMNDIRHALVDCFLSTINGMKSGELSVKNDKVIEEQYLNMFYYLEALIQQDNLYMDAEQGRQLIDLYTDIVTMLFDKNA